jgi:hypothetical protein
MENKNLILKIWDIAILILVFVSLFFLVKTYFLLTPEAYNQFSRYNVLISYIFLADLILRLFVFKMPYFKSPYFIIDLLACLDVFLPVFKMLKSIRLLRLLRLFRFARLARLFKVFTFLQCKNNFVIKISLSILIVFGFLSVFLSNFVSNQVKDLLKTEYTFFIQNLFEVSNTDEELISHLLNKENILSFEIRDVFQYSVLDSETTAKLYFDDDIIEIFYGGMSIRFVNKNLTMINLLVELFILLSVIPIIIIIFIISKICFNDEK